MLAGRQLLFATAAALLAAVVLLLTVVLPAEYGRDPTGIGALLGLAKLSESAVAVDSEPGTAQPPVEPLRTVSGSYTAIERELTLGSRQGIEFKARMRAGDAMLFNWTAEGGPVHFDMHGEPAGATGDEFTSFRRGKHQPSGNGLFTAPFDGTHGWYWKNMNPHAVSIRVRISGHYSEAFIKQ